MIDMDGDDLVSREEFLVDFKAKHGDDLSDVHFVSVALFCAAFTHCYVSQGDDMADGMLHEDMDMSNAPPLPPNDVGEPLPKLKPNRGGLADDSHRGEGEL
jgi:hypothetical protein